jgi:uncharacterized protein (TIGR00106 family)
VSPYVARAVNMIKQSGLPHKMGSMGTCIEGEWEEVMGVVDRCFKELKQDCSRIYMTIKVDYREGTKDRMEGKLRSVKKKL